MTAAFFNFHPDMVRRAMPSCWEIIDPLELSVLRVVAASAALCDLCPEAILSELVGLLPLLLAAAERCDGVGRVLAGANRELWARLEGPLRGQALPEIRLAVAEAWQACTTLREHRGDGHVAALTSVGLSGLEAHLMAAGSLGVAATVLRDNRGWSEESWDQGVERLADRGLLTADGKATRAGHELHRAVEALTDTLAEEPYSVLSETEVHDLYAALYGCARHIQDGGLYPFPNPMGLPKL